MEQGAGIFELIAQGKKRQELSELMERNEESVQFGLVLTQEEAGELVACRNESLRKWGRVEFGKGILDKLVQVFCDSPYLNQDNYLETLKQLQEVFYEFKNETQDQMTDDELLNFMREQLEEVCGGDVDYLESTCLDRLGAGVRAGYKGFEETDGRHIYGEFSGEKRWDKDLYMEVVRDLFW